MERKNVIAYLRENRDVIRELMKEGRLSDLQIEICRGLGILKDGE
jgi:hypothetical protein